MENDSEYLNDLLSLIGHAVSQLLKSGETPDAENIINTLRNMSTQSTLDEVREQCVKACDLMTRKRLH